MARRTIAELVVELEADTKDFRRELLGAVNAIEQNTESMADASKSAATKGINPLAGSITELKSTIDVVAGSIRAFADVARAAFEFAEAGAQVNQMRESADMLGLSLANLRAAAGGTIDDMTLLSSTAKLLAGTSGELEDAMAEAAPDLLEIARAAVKLDPTIGSVAETYQSLAAGIKRNSPLLIDNANIVVKQSEAQEQLAKSLGKTADELTDTEKSQALLFATLKGGEDLIDQLGGSIDSATDDYARLRTEIKILTDEMKANAADGLGPIVSNMALFLKASRETGSSLQTLRSSFAAIRAALTGTSPAIREYEEQMAAVETENERARLTAEAYARVYGDEVQPSVSDTATAFDQYNQAVQNANAAKDAAETTFRVTGEAAANAAASFDDAAARLGDMSRASLAYAQIDVLRQAMEDDKLGAQEFAEAQEAILRQFGLLTDAEVSAQSAIDSITQSFLDGKIGPEGLATAIDTLKARVDELDGRTVTVDFEFNAPPLPNIPGGGPRGTQREQARQSGGPVSAGETYLVGEEGAELFVPEVSGQIVNHRETRRMMNQSNEFNLTMQTPSANAAAVVRGFESLRAMVSR